MPTPSRHRVVPAVAALSTGLLLILSGCSSRPDVAAPPAPTPAASSPAASTPPASTPGASTPAATSRPAPVPAGNGKPAARPDTAKPTTARPASTTSTRYAQLVDVWHTGPSSYALVYDRVEYLTGPAAAAYYREHPDKERLDFAVVNSGTELTQLPVAAKGVFSGNQQLGPGNGSQTAHITGDQLIARLKSHPRTLVKVTERPAGNHSEVVEIAEVYLP